MHTIVLATQKGGSGKSTLRHRACAGGQEAGHNVRLIETDQQGTLSNWQRRRGRRSRWWRPSSTRATSKQRLEALEQRGRDARDHRHRRRHQRGDDGRRPPFRLLHDPGPSLASPTSRRARDAERRPRLEKAVRLHPQPDADPRPAHRQRGDDARRRSRARSGRRAGDAFIVMRNDHQDALAAGLAVGESRPSANRPTKSASLWRWVGNAAERRTWPKRGVDDDSRTSVSDHPAPAREIAVQATAEPLRADADGSCARAGTRSPGNGAITCVAGMSGGDARLKALLRAASIQISCNAPPFSSFLALRAPEGRAAVLGEAADHCRAAVRAARLAFAVIDLEGMLEIAELA